MSRNDEAPDRAKQPLPHNLVRVGDRDQRRES
jgi:hypothetical protein